MDSIALRNAVVSFKLEVSFKLSKKNKKNDAGWMETMTGAVYYDAKEIAHYN